jgi:hypothetical protein
MWTVSCTLLYPLHYYLDRREGKRVPGVSAAELPCGLLAFVCISVTAYESPMQEKDNWNPSSYHLRSVVGFCGLAIAVLP